NYFVDMAHLPEFFAVRDRYVNIGAPPASTAIQVVRLAREGALFEIEAVAVIPERAARARTKPTTAKRGIAKRGTAIRPAAKRAAAKRTAVKRAALKRRAGGAAKKRRR